MTPRFKDNSSKGDREEGMLFCKHCTLESERGLQLESYPSKKAQKALQPSLRPTAKLWKGIKLVEEGGGKVWRVCTQDWVQVEEDISSSSHRFSHAGGDTK